MRTCRCVRKGFALVIATLLLASAPLAQTQIKLPKNKFTPEQDAQLGQQAAAEVLKKYPIIQDQEVAAYLDSLGKRLVAVAPPELNQPAFRYSFTPVNLPEINAFALPGGPMFVNRGMFDAAATEGEVVGVMAHELSHVLLRHGTANITKSQNPAFGLGRLGAAIAGAAVGGGWGQMISQGGELGLSAALLKYSRDYEKQADLLGAQIMARAGYDPRDLGRMFETIAGQSGGGAPQWLSSHPNPGNRSEYIAREAQQLRIATPPDTSGFDRTKSRFAAMPRKGSVTELAAREAAVGGGGEPAGAVGTIGQPVPLPSTSFRDMRGDLFEISVPENWQGVSGGNNVKFVPPNAYGQQADRTVFTHGVQIGVVPASTRDLAEATGAFLQALARNNPNLRQAGQPQALQISKRRAIGTPLVNQSENGGRELIGLYTAFLADGNLFYYLTLVPDSEAQAYRPAFERIGRSIRLRDAR
jgi:Zn-dependent protease with chaperone function